MYYQFQLTNVYITIFQLANVCITIFQEFTYNVKRNIDIFECFIGYTEKTK